MLVREERRQGRLCGSKPGPCGPATWSLFPLVPAWQACGMAASGPGPPWRRSGQCPCSVVAGAGAADEGAQDEGGGAVREAGGVGGRSPVVGLVAPRRAGGQLG